MNSSSCARRSVSRKGRIIVGCKLVKRGKVRNDLSIAVAAPVIPEGPFKSRTGARKPALALV